MNRNILFAFIGLFGGLWLAWPGILTNKGWICTKDIVINSYRKPKDSKSFIEDLHSKLKLTSALSTKTLLKVDNLSPMDKLRVVADACFRS